MTTNASATLYRREYDEDTRRVTWTRVELGAVFWQDERHVSAGNGVFSAANSVLVLIPNTNESPAVEGRIVRGTVDAETPPKGALSIVSAVLIDFGSSGMHHWEVTAK